MSVRRLAGLIFLSLLPLTLGFNWDESKFMSVDEIKPGMKGIARTVFEGTKIEEFEVRILSVQRNAFPKSDLIRAVGIDDRIKRTGVLWGMSGSPVYVDGRLIGAIAYAYSFSKEPIMGITPIESMLKVWDYGGGSASEGTCLLLFSPGELLRWVRERMELASAELPSPGELRPIKVPVAISGFSPQAARALRAILSEGNFTVVEGGGGGRPDLSPPIVPGAVVGTEFIRGDLTAFGYGTVTYREGDRILIFGHPAYGEGKVEMPLSGGYVHCVVPSLYLGFKLAGPTKPFGTMIQDREFGCAGIIGPVPPYIPVKVKVRTADGRAIDYSYEVVRHRYLTPALITSAVWTTIDAAEKETGNYTVRVKAVIVPEKYPAIVKENVFSGSASPGLAAASVLYPISTLMRNQFEEINIRRVELEVKVEDERRSASIVEARLDKQVYKPGEAMRLTVTIRPYLEDPIQRTVEIRLPDDMPEGNAMAVVGSAAAVRNWERTRAPQRYTPCNVQQLLRLLQEEEPNDRLVVEIVLPKPGLTVSGEEMPNLPISMLYVMNPSTQAGEVELTKGTVLLRRSMETGFVLSGSAVLRFTVSRKAR